jgi:hypothetical protein
MSLKLVSEEEMIRLKINSLASKILDCSNQRDILIGKAVAVETKGMNYPLQKAFSLGIRWYSCKDMECFKQGYREILGNDV